MTLTGGIASFSKRKKEKNVFKSLFGQNSDSEESSSSSDDSDDNYNLDSSANDLMQKCQEEPHHENALVIDGEGCSYYQTVVNGELHPLRISIREKKILGIAHQLWPAAGYLCDYLLAHPEQIIFPLDKHRLIGEHYYQVDLLEIGAGLGLTGIYLGAFFNTNTTLQPSHQTLKIPSNNVTLDNIRIGKVVCTDIDEAIAGIQENIDLNRHHLVNTDDADIVVSAEELFWGKSEHVHNLMEKYFPHCISGSASSADSMNNHVSMNRAPPLVIAADVVYWECLFQPLVDTLQILCHDYHCHVIIAHFKRWKKDSKFFALCKKHSLEVVVLEEKITRERDVHHNNPDSEEMKKTIQRIYRIQAVNK